MEQYQVIDEKNWKRAMHCSIFRNYTEPCFCISLELDITKFNQKRKELGLPFTYSLIYVVTNSANQIEEFRYRFLDGKIVLFDRIHTSFTYLDPNSESELFKVVNVNMESTLQEYVEIATKTAENQKEYFTGPLGTDIFQFSPLPWITYTHISHTNSGKANNGTPLFDWGKYFERDGRLILPFSVQAHHSFVDGVHVGKFVHELQEELDHIEDLM